jgi:hypothetical protein
MALLNPGRAVAPLLFFPALLLCCSPSAPTRDGLIFNGDGSARCADPEEACRGSCVDLSSDSGNCGACGNACEIQSPSTVQCVNARCEATLTAGQPEPHHLFVRDSAVYWDTTSAVMTIPTGGGSAAAVVANESPVFGLFVDANSLYWTSGPDGSVEELALQGGSPVTIAGLGGMDFGVTADSSNVYWTDAQSGTVQAVSVNAGEPWVLAAHRQGPYGIASDDDNVYWADTPFESTALHSGFILSIPKTGGEPVTLATGGEPYGLLVWDGLLYWTDLGGEILSVPVGGGAPVTLSSSQTAPAAIATDGVNLYWTNVGNPTSLAGSIVRMTIGGGQPVTLVSDGVTPLGIAVDSTSVYWTDDGAGTIMRLTPK